MPWRSPGEHGWRHAKVRHLCLAQGSQKDEGSETMLVDYEHGPRSLGLQNHMENLTGFEDSWLFDHRFPEREFSSMDYKNGADLNTLEPHLWDTPGRSRVENLVAWECPGSRLESRMWKCQNATWWSGTRFPKRWTIGDDCADIWAQLKIPGLAKSYGKP